MTDSYHIEQAPDPISINNPISEFETGTHSRAIPPAEHWILVGPYENFMCLRWILRTGLYVFQIEFALSHIHPELALTRHLLLYSNTGIALKGLLRIKELGLKLLTSENLALMKYPGSLVPGTIYAVYSVEPDEYFWGKLWRWDLAILDRNIFLDRGNFPFTITLEKALSVRA